MFLKKEGIKYIIFFSLLIVLYSTVINADRTKMIVDIPTNFIYYGKNVSIITLQPPFVGVDVDGVSDTIKYTSLDNDIIPDLGNFTYLNGVYFFIYGYSQAPSKVILDISIDFICGDNVCSRLEDHRICCSDCGCGLAKEICLYNRCLENVTKPASLNKCNANIDCDDKNACTLDTCDTVSLPTKCVRTSITTCINGDGCCPGSCESDTDQDCALIDKCKSNFNCNDNNPCTEDTCDGQPKRCNNIVNPGCILNDQCVPTGTQDNGKYCKDQWLTMKADGSKCKGNFECFSNKCTLGRCGTLKDNFLVYLVYTITIVLFGVIAYLIRSSLKKNKVKTKENKKETK